MILLRGILVVCFLNVFCNAEVSDSQLLRAVTTFSLDLVKSLYLEDPGNLVASPVSLSTLLAILNQGARNNTSTQLESALHLTKQESLEGYGQLSRSWKEEQNTTAVLEMANRVFVRRGLELRQDFEHVVSVDFQSGLQQVSFGSGEGSTAINSWVSEATHGRIPSIVEPVLPGTVEMVLANAVYFKSPWLHQFKRQGTRDRNFKLPNGTEVIVPFMHLNERLHAGDVDSKWVLLPFQDGGYSMLIIVLGNQSDPTEAIRTVTADNLLYRYQYRSRRFVRLALPRFKLDSSLDLKTTLQNLGVTDIFDEARSDLSGVTSSEGLVVSKVFQKADIDVDEDGATASAATIVETNRKSAVIQVDPLEVTIDRPFLAVIYDGSGIPLFMSIVVDPTL